MKNGSTSNTTPLPADGTAGQQFHAPVSMASSENDIDILNKAMSSQAKPSSPYTSGTIAVWQYYGHNLTV